MCPTGTAVFAVNDRNELVRLNDADGTAVWKVQLPGLLEGGFFGGANEVVAHYGPVLAGGRLLVASSDGVSHKPSCCGTDPLRRLENRAIARFPVSAFRLSGQET